ncbi:MAG: DUF983 domain-containing protein [Parvibaculum sp.]
MTITQSSPTAEPSTGFERNSRAVWQSIKRGLRFKCPACGEGQLFRKYLKVADTCNHCGEELHHHRADDAPPYFTIFIVGHIVIPLVTWVEIAYQPSMWFHAALWVPMILGLSSILLPMTKGGTVGLQWALKMHGFGGHHD